MENMMNLETLRTAAELIKALTPEQNDSIIYNGITNLNIIKNDMLPYNTIVVSKELFDIITENDNVQTL